jgi:putative protein-disulfide isomerase
MIPRSKRHPGTQPMSATLHYIYDPLCGWCYGATPLVSAAETVEGLELALHGGGLWPEPTTLAAELRRYIKQADARIAEMSGQPFGAAYLDGLLDDPALVLASRPTIAAVLAAQALDASKSLPMLCAIQRAHYVEGRRVVEPEVLDAIAQSLGLPAADFARGRDRAPVDAHIEETRRLMAQVGAAGFPTFVLQIGERRFGVPHPRFAAEPAAFADWLNRELQARAA